MTGGGLLALVAYGTQNVLLSGNPEMTFWYKSYRRYSHFSQESVSFSLEGPNELFWNQPIKLRAKLQRVGDLVSDIYFTFRVPDIYSKDASGNRSSPFCIFTIRFSRISSLMLLALYPDFLSSPRVLILFIISNYYYKLTVGS